MAITSLMTRCGLTGTEAELLASLLQRGPASGAILARRLKTKRTTVYSALQSLEAQGLVTRSIDTRPATFQSIDPKSIATIIQARSERELEQRTLATTQLQRELESCTAPGLFSLENYQISTVTTKEGMHALLFEALRGNEQRALFDLDLAIASVGKSAVLNFLTSSQDSSVHIREIIKNGTAASWYLAQIQNPLHIVKLIELPERLPTDYLLVDGSVYLNNYQEGEEMAIRIDHPGYFESMSTLFEYMWRTL